MNIYVLPPLISSFFALLLGSLVLWIGKPKLKLFFFLWCLTIFIWLFSYSICYSTSSEKLAVLFARFACTAVMFLANTFYQFISEFLEMPEEKKWVRFSYMISFTMLPVFLFTDHLLAGAYKYYWGFYSMAGTYHPVFLAFFFGVFTRGFFILWKGYRQKTSPVRHQQIKYVFICFLIALLGAIDFIPKYGLEFYPFGFLFMILFITATANTILHHRLLDIRLAFKKSMAYSLAAGLIVAAFVIIVLTLTNLFSTYIQINSFAVSIFAALVIALLFNPVRVKIQGIIDRFFYKKTYDYYSTIGKVTRELESMFELEKIYSFVGDVICSTLGLNNIYILALGTSGETYEVVYHSSRKDKSKKEKPGHSTTPLPEGRNLSLGDGSDLIKLLKGSSGIVVNDELSTINKEMDTDIIDNIRKDLKIFDGEAAVPISVDKKFVLVLILGGKLSGDMYTTEDLNLLSTIANQTAIAIKNAGLYKGKVESERMASIGMMSATFAHEVRNPLTSLKTFAQLMPEKYNDQEFRDVFSKIVVGEIERIDGLIRDLLDFSTEKKSSRSNNFNLVSIVDETVEYVKGKLDFEKKKINIEKNYGNNVIDMSGDATNLKQAFINIITNGCQAMNGDGTLKVYINPNGEHVEVAITDTGEGIHPDDISKIFDPFVTTKEMGIGLGLAISKRIVEDHKGSIKVKSQLSKGTTFTISLPVQF